MTRIATPNQLAMRAQNAMLRLIGMILVVGVLAGQATAGEIPDVVLQYADAFAQSLAEAERLPSGQSLRDGMRCRSFKVSPIHLVGVSQNQP